MNQRAGWVLIKSKWASWLQNRGFFLLAFGVDDPPADLPLCLVNRCRCGDSERTPWRRFCDLLPGVNPGQPAYLLADHLHDRRRDPQWRLNPWLLRPILPLYCTLSMEVAGKVVYTAFVGPANFLSKGGPSSFSLRVRSLFPIIHQFSKSLEHHLRHFWLYAQRLSIAVVEDNETAIRGGPILH